MICQRYNTSGPGTVDSPTHFGADGSLIRKIKLKGDYAGVEAEAHGIRSKCRIGIDDVIIDNCRGDGICVHADVNGTGSDQVNASLG